MRGDQNFLCVGQGGGNRIFLRMPRGGDQNLFAYAKGGHQKKLATRDHKQMPPLPVKNDSSLSMVVSVLSSDLSRDLTPPPQMGPALDVPMPLLQSLSAHKNFRLLVTSPQRSGY